MKIGLFALAALLSLCTGAANAAITCSAPSLPVFSLVYVAGGTAPALSNVTITCNRGNTGDNMTAAYEAELKSNGNNALPSLLNRARMGATANYISYDLYTVNCTTPWTILKGEFRWAANETGPKSFTSSVRVCVPAGQGSKPIGTYTDSVELHVKAGNLVLITFTNVSIQVPGVCTVTVPPNLNFNYAAFGPVVNANTSFTVNCNSGMGYSLAVAPTTGAVVGLNYGLSTNTANQTANGAAQPQIINGTMAAGQPGLCTAATCVGSQPHTVTVTY